MLVGVEAQKQAKTATRAKLTSDTTLSQYFSDFTFAQCSEYCAKVKQNPDVSSLVRDYILKYCISDITSIYNVYE